ncbi:uncharacterized protein Dmoj_GI14869 [Drosophila mojavensis]|uniref:Uncharacterized protein n=1 Tax=Drosophila mojavensis TaxID=7230 RepID=B4L4F1_DROMO|nr:uncharacterized protein Dmoj_GI14869 [Drosophila mojavensis]
MNVLPVLLLLLMQQLTAVSLAQADQIAIGTPASSNATKLSMVGPNNSTSNATTLNEAKSANASSSDIAHPLPVNKPVKVNATADQSPVLARGVTNTDRATVVKLPASTPEPQLPKASNTTTTTITPITQQTKSTVKTDKIVADGVSLTTTTTTTTTTSTTTTTTTPSTTTTTTARPKKPTVTSSMAKQIEGEKLDMSALNGGSVAPHVLPVQQMSSSLVNRGENEYIVPIVTVMLAVPLAIAVFIVGYRRFRDLWTTRHYRRMDFLVDGMYND